MRIGRLDGRLFQARGAATGNDRSPEVDLLTGGTMRDVVAECVIREGALQGDDVEHVAAVHSRESLSRSERAPALGGDSVPVRAADAQRGDGTLEAGPARQPHDRRPSRQHQRRRAETPPTRRTGIRH